MFNKYERFSLSLAFLIRILEELSEKNPPPDFFELIKILTITINATTISSPYLEKNSSRKENPHPKNKTIKNAINDIS